MEYRREIAVVYTFEDVKKKLKIMLQHGFDEEEIHIFVKDTELLQALQYYSEVNIHKAGNFFEKVQSIIYHQPLYEVCLRSLQFSEDEMQHYGHLIEKGAYFMVAQHDFPFEKNNNKKFTAIPSNYDA